MKMSQQGRSRRRLHLDSNRSTDLRGCYEHTDLVTSMMTRNWDGGQNGRRHPRNWKDLPTPKLGETEVSDLRGSGE